MIVSEVAEAVFHAVCSIAIDRDSECVNAVDAILLVDALSGTQAIRGRAMFNQLERHGYLLAHRDAGGEVVSVVPTLAGMRQHLQNFVAYQRDRRTLARILAVKKFGDEQSLHEETGIMRQIVLHHLRDFAFSGHLVLPEHQERPIGVCDVKESMSRVAIS